LALVQALEAVGSGFQADAFEAALMPTSQTLPPIAAQAFF
jgi:hypothetical protein